MLGWQKNMTTATTTTTTTCVWFCQYGSTELRAGLTFSDQCTVFVRKLRGRLCKSSSGMVSMRNAKALS